MKKQLIEVSGTEYILELYAENGEPMDCSFQYSEKGNLRFKINEKEYTIDDFADPFWDWDLSSDIIKMIEAYQEGKECYIEGLCKDYGASSAMVYNDEIGTTIEIEMEDDETFDPSKAAIITSAWVYPDDVIKHMVIGFLYDNKITPLYPKEGRHENGEKVWPVR